MRTKLRVVALLVALGVIGFWLFRGADLGWSKTSVPHKQVDPVTELEVNVYENRFVPGVDFLAGGILTSVVIAAVSFFSKPAETKREAGKK